jgi:hypothetical protein
MKGNKEQNRVEELENHLSSSWNRVIYHRLTRGDRTGLFEPLEFFNQLRDLYFYTKVNRYKPSVLVEKLRQLDLTNAQKSFLFYYLDILFFEDNIRNAIERQLHPESGTEDTLEMAYQVEILAEWAKLQPPVEDLYGYKDSLLSVIRDEYVHRRPRGKDELARDVMTAGVKQRLRLTMKDRYDFNRVRQHLDTLPDRDTKLIYLIEMEIEYLQVDATSESRSKRFDQKCKLERAKLERLNELPKLEILMDLAPIDRATEEKEAAPPQGWSKDEYSIRAELAAKAIGLRGDKLSDERMADEMRCSRNTATKYRNKYAEVYAKNVKAAYKAGLQEHTNGRSRSP